MSTERPQADVSLLTGWSEVFSTDNLVLKCVVKESEEAWNYTWYYTSKTPVNTIESSLLDAFMCGVWILTFLTKIEQVQRGPTN